MSDEESSDDEIRPTRSQRSDNEANRRAAMRKRRLQERRNQSKPKPIPTPAPKPMVVQQQRVPSPPRRQAVPRAVVPSPQPTYHSHGIPGVSLNMFHKPKHSCCWH